MAKESREEVVKITELWKTFKLELRCHQVPSARNTLKVAANICITFQNV